MLAAIPRKSFQQLDSSKTSGPISTRKLRGEGGSDFDCVFVKEAVNYVYHARCVSSHFYPRVKAMPATQFNRDSMARWYAKQHLKTDPGIHSVYYLPTNAPVREIRFLEVNELIANRNDDSLEPLDFGVDTGMEFEHKLFVLDVTPIQWDLITRSSLSLPPGWSLDGAVPYSKK